MLIDRTNINKFLFYAIFFLLCISAVSPQCSLNKNGCDSRYKFLSYVTGVDKLGTRTESLGKLEYKIIYLFTDRMVFYKSKDQSPMLKDDDLNDSPAQIENNIERVIFFGEIILECGGSQNKLCHVEQIPGFEKLHSYNIVKKDVADAKIQCIVIPFYENAYKEIDEKMGYICSPNPSEIYELIKFRNSISRKIESTQFMLSLDRFNGIHGILRKSEKFITIHKKQFVEVIGKIYDKGIYLIKNDKTQAFVKHYTFYQLRTERTGAYIVRDVAGTDTLPPNWWEGFEEEPSPDNCCIYFKGDTENMVLCLADASGKKIESSTEICSKKLKESYKEITISLSNIKLYESYYELLTNQNKRKNCNSEEYKFMKNRLEYNANYSIEQDCQNILQNSNEEMKFKLEICQKYYMDEMELELNQITLKNFEVVSGVKECVIDKNNLLSKAILQGMYI
jgi:hypothetical protein